MPGLIFVGLASVECAGVVLAALLSFFVLKPYQMIEIIEIIIVRI